MQLPQGGARLSAAPRRSSDRGGNELVAGCCSTSPLIAAALESHSRRLDGARRLLAPLVRLTSIAKGQRPRR